MNLIGHYDEIHLKGGNQSVFIRQLINNISKLFPGAIAKRVESGLWIENFLEKDLKRFCLFPGFANFAPAYKFSRDFEKFKDEILKLNWGANKNIKTFRVKSERSDKNFPLNSLQIDREIGGLLQDKFKWKVELKKPDLTVNIDIGSKQILVYGNQIKGAGGLPVGVSGKALALLSGGIDSPVAAYQMMCRGLKVDLVHFQNETRVTAETADKIHDLAKQLARVQGKIDLYVVNFADIQRDIIKKIPGDKRMLVVKKIILDMSAQLARKENYSALVTGDSLGQVASQTLENLKAIYLNSNILVFNPLIGESKREIMIKARSLDTLQISERPYEDCCSLFLSKHPSTKISARDLQSLVDKINYNLDKNILISYHISM